jgi:hypothetical protein
VRGLSGGAGCCGRLENHVHLTIVRSPLYIIVDFEMSLGRRVLATSADAGAADTTPEPPQVRAALPGLAVLLLPDTFSLGGDVGRATASMFVDPFIYVSVGISNNAYVYLIIHLMGSRS